MRGKPYEDPVVQAMLARARGINLQGGVGTVPYGPVPYEPTPLDPQVQDYLNQYTSTTDLANRLANLVSQGVLGELEAGTLYNQMLGIKPSDEITLAYETAKADYEDPRNTDEERVALKTAFDVAKRVYDEAQAEKNQRAGMFIRAGVARGVTAGETEAASVRAERIAGINYVNKLNAGVQADYEEELAKAEEEEARRDTIKPTS